MYIKNSVNISSEKDIPNKKKINLKNKIKIFSLKDNY